MQYGLGYFLEFKKSNCNVILKFSLGIAEIFRKKSPHGIVFYKPGPAQERVAAVECAGQRSEVIYTEKYPFLSFDYSSRFFVIVVYQDGLARWWCKTRR